MEKLQNLKDRICDFDNLIGAYRDAAKNKRYRAEVINFTLDLGENLLNLQEELLNQTYKVGKYREFYVRRPKPRLIMALSFRDRIVQWAIYRQINPYLDKQYITHSYGCRTGKGTFAAAKQFHNWQQLISRKKDADDWYVIKGDISKYFYRVDHDVILDAYREVSDDEWFLWLMSTIINNPDVPFGLPINMKPDDYPRSERLYHVGMAIGNLTSQETANLLLNRLDQLCTHKLHLHFYVRYMDDFTIFVKGKDEARRILEILRVYLHDEMKLELNPKSRIQKATETIEFVGYVSTPYGIRIRKSTTKSAKTNLKRIAAEYADGKIDIDRAKETIVSYKGLYEKVSGYNMCRWIEENIVLQRKDTLPVHEPPGRRLFYAIEPNQDGTVDVYLYPNGSNDLSELYVVKGVTPYAGLDDDIRMRYYSWCDSGEKVAT